MEAGTLQDGLRRASEEVSFRKREIKKSRAALREAAKKKSEYEARLAELGISFQHGGDENHGRQ